MRVGRSSQQHPHGEACGDDEQGQGYDFAGAHLVALLLIRRAATSADAEINADSECAPEAAAARRISSFSSAVNAAHCGTRRGFLANCMLACIGDREKMSRSDLDTLSRFLYLLTTQATMEDSDALPN